MNSFCSEGFHIWHNDRLLCIKMTSEITYRCNIHAKYYKDTQKTLGEVKFTMFALSSITLYVQWSRIRQVKMGVHFRRSLYLVFVTDEMGLDVRKPVFEGLQKTKAETRLRGRDQRLCYLLIEKYHI